MARSKPIAHARRLRRDMTRFERRLWSLLRQRPEGLKFRRQHPACGFIADFACVEARLIIELDGSQHADQAAADARRTAILEAHGWQVMRFWNLTLDEAPFMAADHIIETALMRVRMFQLKRQSPD
jgi:very-short-patch-repair endonuclease